MAVIESVKHGLQETEHRFLRNSGCCAASIVTRPAGRPRTS